VETRDDGQAVYLISGPSASGKSTVGRLLAEQFPHGVHVEGDFFRRSIVAGRHEPTPSLSPAALGQLMLRYRLGASAADTYFDSGFTVVLEDVIAGQLLSELAAMVRSRPLHVIVLLATPEVLSARDASRASSGYSRWSVEELHDAFVSATPRLGLWLDTSEQTPLETVESILARTSAS
jgi:chloramphenicol 3-O-phosphotransferase